MARARTAVGQRGAEPRRRRRARDLRPAHCTRRCPLGEGHLRGGARAVLDQAAARKLATPGDTVTRRLHIAPTLSLPLEAATETWGILAKKGAGKSNAAVVMAEEL